MSSPQKRPNSYIDALLGTWVILGLAAVVAITFAYADTAEPRPDVLSFALLLTGGAIAAFLTWLACSALLREAATEGRTVATHGPAA